MMQGQAQHKPCELLAERECLSTVRIRLNVTSAYRGNETLGSILDNSHRLPSLNLHRYDHVVAAHTPELLPQSHRTDT